MKGRSDEADAFRVKSLTVSVYLPTFLFSVGQGAAIPIIALLALDLGATPAMAGLIVALRGIGILVFDLPAGILVARYGERRSMVMATSLLGLIALGIGSRPSLPLFALLVLLMGFAYSVWALARLTFATEATPPRHRGRVMSMMGGVNRTGQFVGPLLGSLTVIGFGLVGPFFLQAVFAVMASIVLRNTPELESYGMSRNQSVSIRSLIRAHGSALRTAGFVSITVQVLRSAREAIIPLWGDQMGLTASQVSLVFAASSGTEMLVFYPAGILMDRKGRRWAAIPCLLLLSLGVALIPFTATFIGLLAVGVLLGVANGFGAGINMTLGSDLSPRIGRSQFLGIWRLLGDMGTAGGPLLIAITTSMLSLSAAPFFVAGLGLAGAAVMWRSVPETLVEDLE